MGWRALAALAILCVAATAASVAAVSAAAVDGQSADSTCPSHPEGAEFSASLLQKIQNSLGNFDDGLTEDDVYVASPAITERTEDRRGNDQDEDDEKAASVDVAALAKKSTSTLQEYNLSPSRWRNKKQKAWAAKMLSKLESDVCEREFYHKHITSWFSSSGCNGWQDIGTVCYEQCKFGEFNERCGSLFCVKQERLINNACLDAGAKIALSFYLMFANLVPTTAALTKIRTAVAAGTVALRSAIVSAVKSAARNLVKKARKNLSKYVKATGKDISPELQDAIMQGGAEELAEVVLWHEESGAVAEAAKNLVEAVDPTGITTVVRAFEADACRDKEMEPMPDADLDLEESSVANSYVTVYHGLCYASNVVRVYDNDDHNPGDDYPTSVHECASACSEQRTPTHGSWQTLGTATRFAMWITEDTYFGRCYCMGNSCERKANLDTTYLSLELPPDISVYPKMHFNSLCFESNAVRVYDNDASNPGVDYPTSLHKCATACVKKLTPTNSGSWATLGTATRFSMSLLDDSNFGRCYCLGNSCTKHPDHVDKYGSFYLP